MYGMYGMYGIVWNDIEECQHNLQSSVTTNSLFRSLHWLDKLASVAFCRFCVEFQARCILLHFLLAPKRGRRIGGVAGWMDGWMALLGGGVHPKLWPLGPNLLAVCQGRRRRSLWRLTAHWNSEFGIFISVTSAPPLRRAAKSPCQRSHWKKRWPLRIHCSRMGRGHQWTHGHMYICTYIQTDTCVCKWNIPTSSR